MSPFACACALVVDDDPILVELAAAILRARGVREILKASDGAAALDVLAHRLSDVQLIVCDLQMPNLDGIAFLRKLGALRFTGSVVIVSSMNDAVLTLASRLAQTLGVRVLGVVSKPLQPAALNRILDAWQAPVARAGRALVTEMGEAALRQALADGDIIAHYQPKLDIATGRILGAEALARWKSPDGTLVAPDRFIPLAERTGLIAGLDRSIMQQAIADLPRARAISHGFTVSVNASAQTLGDVAIYDVLVDLLAVGGLDHSALVLEVTESQVLKRTPELLEVLGRLSVAGFHLAIDDFGTGFSNLETLREFPFNEIKIDRSFVKDALSCKRANASVASCLMLGRALGMTVVAEGVETAEHWNFLALNRTPTAQGYYIAKPMALDDLLSWMRQRNSGPVRLAG
jgi:EAL domain-containing protein (putative c-di-GMP-specific phosphodiesterase class I)/ActR/RegA family two-component response regulator